MYHSLRILILYCLCTISASKAAVPVILAYEVVGEEILLYAKEGHLLAGNQSGQSYHAPLMPDQTLPILKEDIASWDVLSAKCGSLTPQSIINRYQELIVQVSQVDRDITIQVLRKTMPLAENRLMRPAKLCSARLLNLDSIPGPELVIGWQLGQIPGISIFRIPETVR